MLTAAPVNPDSVLPKGPRQDVVDPGIYARRKRTTGITEKLPPAWRARHQRGHEEADVRWKLRATIEGRATAATRDLADTRGRWAHVSELCEVLEASGDRNLVKRGMKLRACSVAWTHWATAGGDARLTPQRCDDRLCPACSYHRGRRVRDIINDQVTAGERVRFITLTQVALDGESAADGRARIVAHWRRFWREHQRSKRGLMVGGLRRVEVTWRGAHWHWHVHVLAVGAYWPQEELSAEWAAASADGEPVGSVVDIRSVNGSEASIAELSKYALKSARVPPEKVVEFCLATWGRRDVATFGTWYRIKLEVPDPATNEAGEKWHVVKGHAVETLARSHGSGFSPAEVEAATHLEEVTEAGKTLAEWRNWAYSVRMQWLGTVHDMEEAADNRAAGRDARAKRRKVKMSGTGQQALNVL